MIDTKQPDYRADLERLQALQDDPDLDLEVCTVANRHGKTEDQVCDDLDQRSRHDCNVLELATIEPEPIRWLWPGRIPLAMYSLLAGQPGVGKSTIAFSIAAIVTTGSTWPYSTERAEIGDVVILTAEDDPKYTLVPRLLAAGADVKRTRVIQSVEKVKGDDQVIDCPLTLSEDMNQLDRVLNKYPDTKLMIFDPLSAYLGVKDSHRDADVRQVLGPLTELAGRHQVAILGITHLSKNAAASAMARFMGSTGIVAAARSAYLATHHEEELLFLPVKSNVAPDVGGLSYRITGKTIGNGIETSCVEWTGQTDIEADEALAAQNNRHAAPKKHDAIVFLKNKLKDGPSLLSDISDAAESEGITWATVRRAYEDLNLEAIKEKKFQGRWFWHTPEQAAKLTQPETTECTL